MNFNANSRQPGPIRKAKRVSDVNAIGPTLPATTNSYMPMQQGYPSVPSVNPVSQPIQSNPDLGFSQYNSNVNTGGPSYGFNVNQNDFTYGAYQQPMPTVNHGNAMAGNFPMQQQQQPSIASQFAMFQQPMVQDMAVQYGQKLAGQGKEMLTEKVEKYIPVTRLKYYFAVDNKYVINKLRLLFFPFTHYDWALKYDQDNPVQPRYDINAPDLYIPSMAYITYIVLAGFVLGMQNRFSPEQLGITASSALAYSLFELVIYSITLYIANIPTTLTTLDLLAYSSYKYVIIVACVLFSIAFQRTGYYISLIYCGLAIVFFLLRTLKAKITEAPHVTTSDNPSYDTYDQQQFQQKLGRKRKLYFLFLVAGLQPVLSFWLSLHLIPTSTNL